MKAGLILAAVVVAATASGGVLAWRLTADETVEEVLQQPTVTPAASRTPSASDTPSVTPSPVAGAPHIDAIDPPSATFQTEVAILGSGFPTGGEQGCSVHFNEFPALVLDCNRAVDITTPEGPTRTVAIIAVTPVLPESGQVMVTVTVDGLTSNAFPLDVKAPPPEDYGSGMIYVTVRPGASIYDAAADIGDSAEGIERVFPNDYLDKITVTPEDRASQERMYTVKVPAGREIERVVAYSLHPLVEHAELMATGRLDANPNDEHYQNGRQWWVNRIGLPTAWDYNKGAGVTIAVLDSGVRATHEDLDGHYDAANSQDYTGAGLQDDCGRLPSRAWLPPRRTTPPSASPESAGTAGS